MMTAQQQHATDIHTVNLLHQVKGILQSAILTAFTPESFHQVSHEDT